MQLFYVLMQLLYMLMQLFYVLMQLSYISIPLYHSLTTVDLHATQHHPSLPTHRPLRYLSPRTSGLTISIALTTVCTNPSSFIPLIQQISLKTRLK